MYTAVPAVDDMQVCHAEGFRLFKQAPGRSGKVSPGTKEPLFYVWWAKSGRYNRPFLDTIKRVYLLTYRRPLTLWTTIEEPPCARSGAPWVINLVNYPSEKNLVMTSPYVRTDSPGRDKYKRIPPLSPRQFCNLLFQKPLETVNWPNVWWILGADHLTLESVMGDFRKNVLQTDFKSKKACKLIPEKKTLKKYRSRRTKLKKKSYTVIRRGKNF